jgi:ABC-type polysaccharide/polyol phosphate export permease
MSRRLAEIWRFRQLVQNLTYMNLLVKYRGSLIGFLWSLLNPLVMMFVYVIAFKLIMRVPIDNYGFFLLTGLLPWSFFATAVTASSLCVLGNGGLVKKVKLPREVFPLSTVAFNLVQFMLAMLVFAPFVLVLKPELSALNLLYFAVVLMFVVFTLGVCLAVSALTVPCRDVQHFTELGTLWLFWVSPVVYDFSLIPEEFQSLARLNPMTLFMNAFHDLLYHDVAPSLFELAGAAAWSLAALVAGWMVFLRIEPRMAEEL